MTKGQQSKESWGTRVGVILAVTGSAVGLGNFLRFPGLAAQYEGGAFMIPYFVALLVLGLPLAWAEWAMGRFGGARGFNSAPGIYRAIWRNRLAPYCGVLGMLVPVAIYMYYVLIESWCLGYAYYFLSGEMSRLGAQAALPDGGLDKKVYVDFFTAFTGADANGAAASSGGASPLVFLAVCFTLNFVLIYRGLRRGIERFCLVAMPALVVCAVIVLVRVLTLPGITDGLGFMWNARTESKGFVQSLLNADMWLAATGQIFFSLSIGFGIIVTYSSYLKRGDDIALSSLTASAGNEFCEVALGGMITIPAAFLFLGAVQVTAAAGSSFNLGFLTLPMVFESMPMGRAVGFLFFFLLFLAAVTSSLSMLQPAIALLEEGLCLNRRASVALLGFITLMGTGFIFYFSEGTLALATFDFWVGTFFIFLLALFQTILFGWVLGVDRGMAELDNGAEIRVPRAVGYMLKYVSPVYLSVIFVAWLYKQITTEQDNMFHVIATKPIAKMAVVFIGLVALLFVFLIGQSVKRWERDEQSQEEVRI